MMMMMKIAHVTATFWPQRTGTGNVAYHNALELARRKHDLHVFAPRIPSTPASEGVEGVQVHRLWPLVRYGNAPVLPVLFGRLRGFDIVHLHLPFYGGAEPVALLRWLKKIPLVITHHQDVQLKGVSALVSRTLDALVNRPLMARADRVCFTSLDYAHASQLAGPLIAQGRIRYGPVELPNGVDTRRFEPGQPTDHLANDPRFAGQRVVLFVGVLDRAHYFKGVDVLLHALATANLPHTVLLVVGKGDRLATYQQQACDLGIGERVHFAGFVPDEELADYYRLADVTVLPSTTAGEAFGLVLVESLACGTPVIASGLPGVRTVVADGQDGLLAQPGNAEELATRLQTLLSLPQEQRRAMGQAGRRKVEATYAWPHIGDRLQAIYDAVVAERPHPRKRIEPATNHAVSALSVAGDVARQVSQKASARKEER
ncbi:MAG: glycosyltransferase family 4 protein [Chloroflexaceae bacterium]|nr:glycosyltransferase family 4 protein [Chloroflexaceae bacterium]